MQVKAEEHLAVPHVIFGIDDVMMPEAVGFDAGRNIIAPKIVPDVLEKGAIAKFYRVGLCKRPTLGPTGFVVNGLQVQGHDVGGHQRD